VSSICALALGAGGACAAVDFDEAPGSRCYGTWETIASMYNCGHLLVMVDFGPSATARGVGLMICSKVWMVWDGVVICRSGARGR
jgi:hypothetical protein